MRVIDFDDLPAIPWKNGGGVTRELACHPVGATIADFLWRVSIADVSQSGPFSMFSGIDRIIALLDGDGMRLKFSDGRTHALTAPLAPFRFRGEDQVFAELIGSASRDINLMLRRDMVDGTLEVWRNQGELACEPGFLAFFCGAGQWRLNGANGFAQTLTTRQTFSGVCEGGNIGFVPLQPCSALLIIRVLPSKGEA